MSLMRRPMFSRRRLLIAVTLIVALVPIAAWVARKQIVGWALHRALASAGLGPATFKVRAVDFSSLQIEDLSIGSPTWLTAGGLNTTYSLSDLKLGRVQAIDVHDARWTVKVHDGSVDWGFTPRIKATPAGPVTLGLPFSRLDISRSTIQLVLDDATHEVPITAQLTPTGSSAVDGHADLVAAGRPVTLTARATSTPEQLKIDLDCVALHPNDSATPVDPVTSAGSVNPSETTPAPPFASLHASVVRAQTDGSTQIDLNGTVNSLHERGGDTEISLARADLGARAELDGQSKLRAMTSSISAQDLRMGDLVFSDLQASAGMPSASAVDLTSFSAILGEGEILNIDPFTLDLRSPRAKTRVSLSNVSMAEWLPVLTRGHATGEGRVSGELDIAINLTGGKPRLEELTGNLRADPQNGFIQVADADAAGRLLESQDPRFATDEVMRPMRDRMVAALQDFAFQKLTVDLSRQANHTVAQANLSGFGRHGQDPQGINLTLDLHVDDELVDLASRVPVLSKIIETAQGALDALFAAPAEDEKR